MKSIRYIFPKTKNFREERPSICWEDMYGWLDGYGILFDPAIFLITNSIPEWENGFDKNKIWKNDFIITACSQASELFKDENYPGIYIRPSFTNDIIIEKSRLSEKERLITPIKDMYYPFNLPFDKYNKRFNSKWLIGENTALVNKDKSTFLAFELFTMIGTFRSELAEEYLTLGADLFAEILKENSTFNSKKVKPLTDNNMRIDFQAYGLNRLFIQWFLELKNKSKTKVKKADELYITSIKEWEKGNKKKAEKILQKAFEELKRIREKLSKLEVSFLEYPHLGILFEDKGYFELEWPEYARKMLLSYFEQIEKYNYKVSIENGASSWESILKRYPDLGLKLKKLWEEGKIELTNGTYSLPFALLSPLTLQYWQFKKGSDTFKKLFGKVPSTYQCQENSLTPQMPELLKYFNYKRALHITQNRGETPSENVDLIHWKSPSGHGINAMTTPNPKLSRKGNNYFFDLPLIHHELKNDSLNYINFQDLGYVPFRIQMIRAHKYASIWGHYAFDEEFFEKNKQLELKEISYTADDYKFSENVFYPDKTNVNSLSHYELVYSFTSLKRQIMLVAYANGSLKELYSSINQNIENICILEAHDCSVVQGQRRGEFYATHTMDPPPYSREELTEKINEIAHSISSSLDRISKIIISKTSNNLYNAAEVPLSFARVQYPELLSQLKRIKIKNYTYASGTFNAFDASEALDTIEEKNTPLPFKNNTWKIEVGKSERINIEYKDRKISLSPIDKKVGNFELLKSEFKKYGTLNLASFTYQQNAKELQSVVLDIIFSDESDYLEINVKYSPRNNFDVVTKWDDYLAIDIDMNYRFNKVWRFNPNVRALTKENSIVSPYFIELEPERGNSISCLNEGATFYEIEREKGHLKWLFHVACETVHERRMVLSFANKNPFLLARAWGQGLFPISDIRNSSLAKTKWEDISIEDFINPNEILISNLKDTENKLAQNNLESAKNLAGDNLLKNPILQAFEMGLIQAKIIDQDIPPANFASS